MKLAIPQRVYTDRHMDVVVDALAAIFKRRNEIKVLRLFLCRLKPIGE